MEEFLEVALLVLGYLFLLVTPALIAFGSLHDALRRGDRGDILRSGFFAALMSGALVWVHLERADPGWELALPALLGMAILATNPMMGMRRRSWTKHSASQPPAPPPPMSPTRAPEPRKIEKR